MEFVIQLLGSAVAVAALVGLVAWAKIVRDAPPLDETRARALFAEEWPELAVSEVWIAADGQAALGHAGSLALVAWRAGDGYRWRQAPFATLSAGRTKAGKVRLRLNDVATPPLSFVAPEGDWPPGLWTAAAETAQDTAHAA